MAQQAPRPLDSNLAGALHEYIDRTYAPEDDVLRDLLVEARREGLPAINVPPALGKLLGLLVSISGARTVLEIGTLSGYSSIWMARSLPSQGRLISLEIDPLHAAMARKFIAKAGLADRIEVRVGPAAESLERLAPGTVFDMVFIDADKPSYPVYLDWALRLVRPGGLIVADNVLRNGAVLDAASVDPGIQAIRTYNDRVAGDPRLEAVILFTRSGTFAVDGVSIARVRDDGATGRPGH